MDNSKKKSDKKSDKTTSCDDDTVIIKKYANRRLYNMNDSQYIILEDLAKLIRQGKDFVVYDAKTGDDITRSILTQIIVDEENKGNHMLPMSFLREMIGLYDGGITHFSPDYWDAAMDFFKSNHDKMRSRLEQVGQYATFPFTQFQKVADNNRDIMQKTFDMFTNFGKPSAQPNETVTLSKQQYDALIAQIESLQHKKRSQDKS